MSWTVTDDNGTYQVRASITDRQEMDDLIDCLQKRREQMAAPQQIEDKNDE